MPKIYLSPSTQDWNMYVTGSGSEEYNMNLLADALVPYLLSNGIQYQRNRPEMTAGSSIREANQGEYDLYLALHSNAAPEGRYGEERGIIAFYYPGSVAQSSSPRSCGRSIHCPTRSLPAPPLHWERSASLGFPLYCWRSATTTITATPPGWRATGMPSPSRLPGA